MCCLFTAAFHSTPDSRHHMIYNPVSSDPEAIWKLSFTYKGCRKTFKLTLKKKWLNVESAHSCEPLRLHSSTVPWMDHDGQDVWGTIEPPHECGSDCMFLPPLTTKPVFLQSGAIEGLFPFNATGVGQSERPSSCSRFVFFGLWKVLTTFFKHSSAQMSGFFRKWLADEIFKEGNSAEMFHDIIKSVITFTPRLEM